MRPNLKTFAVTLVIGLAAYAAYAETVTVSTYYPSPYGSYQNLDSTGAASFATSSGNVGIGVTAPGTTNPNVKLTVQGGQVRAADTAGGATAIMAGWNAIGAAYFGSATTQPTYIGNTDRNDTLVVNDSALTINGNMSLTGTVVGDLKLEDNASTIANNNTGALQVICDTSNRCYAVAVYS